MAYYAMLDENNIVTSVFVGEEETVVIDGKTTEEYYSEKYGVRCLRTSYNGNIRKNYAGIGMKYDEAIDAFITEQPNESWTLNPETGKWEPPTQEPTEWNPVPHFWNEEAQEWQFEPYYKNSITITSRVLTCIECPFWIPENSSCSKCGCFGKTLHTNPDAVCPEGKW